MNRLLAPLVAVVAVLAFGLMLAFAEQSDPTDPPEPGELSPVAGKPGGLAPFGAIMGEATRGPTCAGPVRQGQVCEETAQVTIDVRDQAGHLVAHLQTDTTGRFLVPLPPGTYRVEATRRKVAQPVSRFDIPHVSPQQVTITSGVVEQVSISIDTGIRWRRVAQQPDALSTSASTPSRA
jgi:hypothetical protein